MNLIILVDELVSINFKYTLQRLAHQLFCMCSQNFVIKILFERYHDGKLCKIYCYSWWKIYRSH